MTQVLPRRAWAVAVLALAAGCSKCGGAAVQPKVDAGVAVRRAIDLRSALIAAMPEWRGVLVDSGRATLLREVTGPFDAEKLKRGFEVNGFRLEEADGGVRGRRDRFILTAEPGVLRWELPLQPDDPDKLLASPVVMTTENMATWFPPGAGDEVRETFTLQLAYSGKPGRVDFLTRQLFGLATHGTWTVEGPVPFAHDAGEAPQQFTFHLVDRATTARLTCTRDGEHVSLTYVLVTFERPAPGGH